MAGDPRVCTYPPYSYTSGDDAIDLADMAGLHLDPWQQLVLRHGLGERGDGKWSAFEIAVIVARQNGKGAILEARELAGLYLFRERLILHSAHEYRTAMEAFRRVRDLVENSDDLRRKVKRIVNTNGEEGIELLSGARLKFIARSKNAGRGFTADCLVWDEAYALTEDQVDAQMPLLSARPNGQIWYTSSPPLDAITGAQLFRVRRRALEGNSTGLAYFDWGAASTLDDLSGIDLDDREIWRATNPAWESGRITEEGTARERAAMSNEGFARERLSIWPPDLSTGYQVIPQEAWEAALLDDGQRPVDPVAFAAEVTLDRRWACIAVAGRRPDGLRQVQIVDHDRDADWVVPRLKELAERWKPCAVVVAGGGPAGTLITDLEAAGIEVLKPSVQEFARAAGIFYDGVCSEKPEARDVRHLGEEALTAAVAGAVKRTLPDGAWSWGRLKSTVDISPLMAATLALYGHSAKAHLFDEYDLLQSVL